MHLKLLCLVMSCIFFHFIVYLEQRFLFHVFVLVRCCVFVFFLLLFFLHIYFHRNEG